MENVIYVKNSSNRKKEFQIRTVISEQNGVKRVTKQSLREEGALHITGLFQYYQTNSPYSGNRFSLCECQQIDNKTVGFSFVEGLNFEVIIHQDVEKNDKRALLDHIDEIVACLNDVQDVEPFEMSEQCLSVLGDCTAFTGQSSARYISFDGIFENFILEPNNHITLIDYEWFFGFTLPIKLVVIRALIKSPTFNALEQDDKDDIYRMLSIQEDEIEACYRIEENFQKYVTGISIVDLSKRSDKLCIPYGVNENDIYQITISNQTGESFCQRYIDIYTEWDVTELKQKFGETIIIRFSCSNSAIKVGGTNGTIPPIIGSNEVLKEPSANDYYFIEAPEFVLDLGNIDDGHIFFQVVVQNNPMMRQYTEVYLELRKMKQDTANKKHHRFFSEK